MEIKILNGQKRLDFKKYTKQIWLAGLGAFSKAEGEGSRLFDSLVKSGAELEAKTNQLFGVSKNKQTPSQSLSFEHNQQIESAVQQPVSNLKCLNVQELQELQKMVLELHKKVDILMEGNQDFIKDFDKK